MERRGAVDTKTTRVEDINSIRNNLLRATAPKTDKLPTEILADAAEAAINKVDMVQRAPSIHSLRDTIEAHVDHAIVSEQLGEIDNASDLNDSIAPPDSTP
jgi:hypothetical protein